VKNSSFSGEGRSPLTPQTLTLVGRVHAPTPRPIKSSGSAFAYSKNFGQIYATVLHVIAETTSELKTTIKPETQLWQQDRYEAVAAANYDDDDDDDDDEDDDEDDAEDENDVVKDELQSDDPAIVAPRPRRKTVNVGSAAVLDCDIEYPTNSGGSYVQHIVTWRKQGVEAPVFIAFDGYPPRLDTEYTGRVRAVGPTSIEIEDVRTSDEGWYECTVLFIDEKDESPGNGTWTHLAVNSTSPHLYCITQVVIYIPYHDLNHFSSVFPK